MGEIENSWGDLYSVRFRCARCGKERKWAAHRDEIRSKIEDMEKKEEIPFFR
ncbi:MAG: hypothetical protein GTO23_02975 [Nitrososphaeria archaeon]|nr:hypothetical protein [Nitrososphaeria archaeon]